MGKASTPVLMDCPGGRRPLMPLLAFIVASTLVLMDCPGGLAISRFNASFAMGFNPCFNGLSRRTGARARRDAGGDASTLVLMDCPGGPGPWRRRRRRPQASTLVLMDCPGGPLEAKRGQLGRRASTLVLMDCPGGPDQPVRYGCILNCFMVILSSRPCIPTFCCSAIPTF